MTTQRETFTISGTAGTPLTAYRWEPAGAPVAAVLIVHGMGEHVLRYDAFADALVAAGFAPYGYDQRGHGASVAPGSEPGHLGAGGWSALVEDIHAAAEAVRARQPGMPLLLPAHSMGSFATQQFLLEHSDAVDAVVLSGTTLLDVLEPTFDLDQPLELATLNAPFEPARTDFDWLSRDPAMVDAYLADPLCGFGLDVEAGREMFAGARRMADPAAVARIRPDLPVHLVSGSDDPINGGGALVELLADRLRTAGVTDVSVQLYPQARHEVLNETNRGEVEAEICGWLAARA